MIKLLKESKATKQKINVKFAIFKAGLLECHMFNLFQVLCRSEFKKLIEESLFDEVSFCI